MKRSIRAVTTGSGTEPSSSTASWKARIFILASLNQFCDRNSESFREQAVAAILPFLRATKFEFEKRFWIICATAVFTPARSTAHTAASWLRH
jgi:hypothetical protein